MENMPHATGFRREVLTEFESAEKHLLALAATVPAEDYGWSPAEHARSFAAVLVHVATGNLLLLDRAGARPEEVVEMYGALEGGGAARLTQMMHKNHDLEQTMTAKATVIALLARSFAAVRECWCQASEEELWATGNFLGERETVRHVYLRILSHAHEHLGQAIAYVRAMGYAVPWEDPLKKREEAEAGLLAW